MLVLSRRPEERIVLPEVGVTVHLVRIHGNTARIGIDAPKHLRVLREELHEASADHPPAPLPSPPPRSQPDPDPRETHHALSNRLNKVQLALHLSRKQRESGRDEQAEATLARAADDLAALCREWTSARSASAAPPAHKPTEPTRRALVVEDDPNERELLAGILAMSGYECATVADGAEALAYLAEHQSERPDFVLLDMRMPRLDGPRTLREIRHDPRCRDLKVFSISGLSPQELGIQGGLDGWFPKPLDPRALCDTIRAACASTIN